MKKLRRKRCPTTEELILQRLDCIERKLTKLIRETKAMTQATTELIAKFDAATNKIAARIQKLTDAVAASGTLTPEDKVAFEKVVADLEALGADPANPVPTV